MRVRICYKKTETGRYLSHLDLARTMERSLRRAALPLAFSEGFNPHPKMSFASALAVGTTGCREYLDVELRRRVGIQHLGQALAQALPPALAFVAAEEISPQSKSLSAIVNLAIYRLQVVVKADQLSLVQEGISRVLAAGELWRKPKDKPGKKAAPAKEVRELVKGISLLDQSLQEEGGLLLELEMHLSLSNSGQLRPAELWEMVGEAGGIAVAEPLTVCRRALLIDQAGKVFAPMEGVAV